MKKGDILLIRLDAGVGHEQYGDRPAILISDTGAGIVIVVPITGNATALRFPYTLAISPDKHNGIIHESVALAFHIRAIDKSRVIKVIGKINTATRRKVAAIIKRMLGF